MTARQRTARARVYLAISVATAALAWAVAAVLASGAALALIARWTGSVPPWVAVVVPAAAALLAAGYTLNRASPGLSLSLGRVALWIEERQPALRFALVTAIDPAVTTTPELERAAAFDLFDVLKRPLSRMLLLAAAGLLTTGAAAWAIGSADDTRDLLQGRRPANAGRPASAANPLDGIRATVTPPAYARAGAFSIDDPSSIAGLRGSAIVLTGPGRGVSASLGDREIPVSGGDRWRAALVMPERPQALTLAHANRRRVIVLEPRADAPPRVRLTSPPRDTIMQTAAGVVRITATIEDDVGISDGHIEYMLSSGAEETFTARSAVTGSRSFPGARRGQLSGAIDLGSLRLGPGDLLSIRAVARDANTVSGRGVGVSDTRTYRVARRDEYDSLAIEAGAPIIPESTVVSQRMLILRTEALVREQRSLARDSVLARVRGITVDQIRLRERVHDLVYPSHTHAEGEIEAEGEPHDVGEDGGPVSPDLKIAYEAMWSASRELGIAEAAAALPFMRTAADALDRARLANRYYLRSGTARVVVDVPRVRLRGDERGTSAMRRPHAADLLRQELSRELARAAAIPDPTVAANELALVRVRALDGMPGLAAALERVIVALRRGRDPAAELAEARRALDGGEPTAAAGGWSRW